MRKFLGVLFLAFLTATGALASPAQDAIMAGNYAVTSSSTTINLYGGPSPKNFGIQAVITDATPGAKTAVSGLAQVDRITFAAKSSTTNGDYFVVRDYAGGSWAIGLDTLGTAAATPTGAAWVAVASGHKAYVDISSATTGSDVELLVATAINLLSGFSTVITTADSTTHLDCTNVAPGLVTAATFYSRAGAAGTGSVTGSATTPGTATFVSVSGDTFTIAAHGYTTGVKLQTSTSSALPTGLLTSTDYYAIVVDANTVALASSLVNALAGTKINLTSYGVGTQTLTSTALSATLKLQVSNDGTNWTDVTSGSQNVTTTANLIYSMTPCPYDYAKLVFTPTAGAATIAAKVRVQTYHEGTVP